MSTLVLGLGNPILTDDAVGPRVAEQVRAALAARPGPRPAVETASVGGLALMEALVGYERAVLIDALWRPGWPPGSLHRLTLDDLETLSPTARSVSPHDTSLAVALDFGRQLGLALPEQIVIYAVAVANVLDFGEEPTPEVAAAIPAAAAAVLTELAATSPYLDNLPEVHNGVA
ncbi:MAG: hydrogenase maturation protease [Chloroflexales bacterium]|nr:hydrogenase maturation protease [Chloroflexales bacterium]